MKTCIKVSNEINDEQFDQEQLLEHFKNSLNSIKNADIYINGDNGTLLSLSAMNGHSLNKYKSSSNHELGARVKIPVGGHGPRSVSRYDSDTITTRYTGSRSDNDRVPIYGQPLNTSTKAFIEAANRKARMVTFYTNGQSFSRPIRMSIIPGKTFKSFHKLCDYLTTRSMIPLGVR